jgi:2-oxo-4-hydroxy-4-carboxy-5-ureidoimidazoline decarboxylase
VTLDQLNAMQDDEARAALQRCCGSRTWAWRMAAGRPYRNRAGLFAAVERIADKLRRADWLEAFAHHPRVGDFDALRTKFAATPAWAGEEQQGAAAAPAATLDLLAEGNRAYEEQFGYIFIVCASGKSAEEMLELLRGRLANDPDTELVNASREQRAITRLRLEKLLEKTA